MPLSCHFYQDHAAAALGAPPTGDHHPGFVHLVVQDGRALLRRGEALPLQVRLQEGTQGRRRQPGGHRRVRALI